KMKISVDELLSPGIELDPQHFSVTQFALNVSRKASGVSKLHTKLSEDYWPRYHWTNITNAVHMPTWQSPAIPTATDDPKRLWHAHLEEKRQLAQFCQAHTGYTFDPNYFVITWARRIAGYKQLDALFADIERLTKIVTNRDWPVQLLITGKAHQGDQHGKKLLKEIIAYMQTNLSGHALYLPNYNIAIAQPLVKGSDLWLNTPQKGKEASGTSGMKAIANGVLQATVSDGWAAEVDWTDLGWVLDSSTLSESIYDQLETEILPMYFKRAEDGVPYEWVARMQRSIELSANFAAKRMFQEYTDNLYTS
ncbi:MAG: alpha-glucan family phosphorylase, partial [Patescibacteria group bacterium]